MIRATIPLVLLVGCSDGAEPDPGCGAPAGCLDDTGADGAGLFDGPRPGKALDADGDGTPGGCEPTGFVRHHVLDPLGVVGNAAVAPADLDLDGLLDLVILRDYTILWMRQLAPGSFAAPVELTSDAHVGGLAVSDLDGDGHVDIAYNDGSVWTLAGRGDGTFEPAVYLGDLGSYRSSVAAMDLDGDGDDDLVAEAWDPFSGSDYETSRPTRRWFENQGASFGWAQRFPDGAEPAFPIAHADLDGDGHEELLWCDTASLNRMSTLGAGAFGSVEEIALPELWCTTRPAAGDLDGDGDPDLAVGVSGGVYGATNDAGSFDASASLVADLYGPITLAAADLDCDGDDDLVAGTSSAGGIVWIPSLPDGLQAPPRVVDAVYTAAMSIQPVDLDGDGDLDLLAAHWSGTDWYENLGGRRGLADRAGRVPGATTAAR